MTEGEGPAGPGSGDPPPPTVGAVVLADEPGGPAAPGAPRVSLVVLGETLLGLSVDALEACPAVHGFVVVVPPGDEREVAPARRSPKFVAAVAAATREEAVTLGLEALPPSYEVVVLHDVSRPLATADLLARVVGGLDDADAAVPCVGVSDTVKRVEEGMVTGTVPRSRLAVAQPPRAFRRAALAEARRGGGTGDELTLMVGAGFRVAAVPGDPANLEVRTPRDVRIAEALLAQRARAGHVR